MAVTVSDLREHLVETPESDKKLEGYIAAAKAKAKTAGIPDFQNNAQYDLLILDLAAMYHDNRGMSFSGTYQATAEANARKLINSHVLELRYAEDGPVSEAGGDESE